MDLRPVREAHQDWLDSVDAEREARGTFAVRVEEALRDGASLSEIGAEVGRSKQSLAQMLAKWRGE